MVQIRKLDPEKGDVTTTCSLEEAIQEVEDAQKNGYLVVDETNPKEQRMLQNVLGIKEESRLKMFPPVAGG